MRISLAEVGPNIAAFLDMIAFSEGTAGQGDDGYNVIFGSTKVHPRLFTDYKDHPHVLVDADGKPGGLASTAAGRYQLLYRYWVAYKRLLNLPDFSPESQDRVAVQQIRECRAFGWIQRGHLDEGIVRCCKIWASLPGAGYGQHENNIEALTQAFELAGGKPIWS